MRIGVVGTGTIASAVVDGIASDGHDIHVSRRGEVHSARLAAAHANVTVAANQLVVDRSDVVLLGLMANQAPAVLRALSFRADQRVVSLMVGPTLDELAGLVAPARAEALAVPFPSIAQGGSPVLVHPESDLLLDLFGERNQVIPLSEPETLNAYLAAQAVLSPILKLLEDTATWLGSSLDDPAPAEPFIRRLVGSALTAPPLDQSGMLAANLQALNTPGGLNAELRDFMFDRGVGAVLLEGLKQLESRLKDDRSGRSGGDRTPMHCC